MLSRRLTAVLVTAAIAALAAPAASPAASRADYVRSTQNSDGGFGMTRASGSSPFVTGWAALGLAAAGTNPRDVRRGGRSAIDYLRANIRGVDDIGEVERTILVVRAAGLNPRRFGGRNLVSRVLAHRRSNGSIAGYVSYTSFGIMALRASGHSRRGTVIRRAVRWLARQQNRDGGFNVRGRGGRSGIDDTGYALEALAAAGRRRSRAARRAVSFLVRHQNADGGFGLQPGYSSNAQSTAYAVQGLVAAGRRLGGLRRGGRTPLGYLASLTQRDGVVRYSRTSVQDPVWVTAQAMAAIARRPFPLRPVRRR